MEPGGAPAVNQQIIRSANARIGDLKSAQGHGDGGGRRMKKFRGASAYPAP